MVGFSWVCSWGAQPRIWALVDTVEGRHEADCLDSHPARENAGDRSRSFKIAADKAGKFSRVPEGALVWSGSNPKA